MRHLIIALILIILIITGVCINGVYVRNAVSDMQDMVEGLPETQAEFALFDKNLDALNLRWQSYHTYLSFSLHMCELERACEAVADLNSSVNSGSFEQYISAKYRLASVLSELSDGESLKIHNIF